MLGKRKTELANECKHERAKIRIMFSTRRRANERDVFAHVVGPSTAPANVSITFSKASDSADNTRKLLKILEN